MGAVAGSPDRELLLGGRCSYGDAVLTRLRSWFNACVRALTLDCRATSRTLMTSTLPFLLLASPRASPAQRRSAAATASKVPDLPTRRLCARGAAWRKRSSPQERLVPNGQQGGVEEGQPVRVDEPYLVQSQRLHALVPQELVREDYWPATATGVPSVTSPVSPPNASAS